MISRRWGIWLMAGVTVLVIAVAAWAQPIGQPESYHHFADVRGWSGVPRLGDVLSNLPFAVIGGWGLLFLGRDVGRHAFVDWRERYAFVLVFFGLLLTAFGSGYYHLAPDNARLVWDRLPMTIVFMSLVAAMIGERISVRLELWLLPFLLLLGVSGVLQWYWSELRGAGDLRFYAGVQVYALLALLVALLLPPRYTRSSDLAAVVAFYVLAKVLEAGDQTVFSVGHVISGHTLKHLAAAGAGYWILRMLRERRPISMGT
jgi:hypothetical protein